MDRDDAGSPPPPQEPLDNALRPSSLEAFVGQSQVTANLGVAIRAARLRDEHVDHVLLSGLPGLGKTTLAEIIAKEMGVGFRATAGPVIDRPGDLAGLLTNLSPGDVLFIDEIHRLPTQVEEYLYSAMEDFKLVILLDQGPRARSVPIDLSPFTLVGATTREGLLSSPFRSRFGIHERLEPYALEDLVSIAARSAGLLDIEMTEEAAALIASGSRGTPRLVNRYLRRIRDVAQVEAKGIIDEGTAKAALNRLGLDAAGMLPLDRRLLNTLARAGTPVGLKMLAVALGEEDRTVEDVYEPFLIREGYMARTARGRIITPLGLEAVGRDPGEAAGQAQGDLFNGT
ncbi:MAG: Holliday junction branch migration DNA helicase RuvB [Planctomycetota bacterium]|nr:Holliday junction branch migration DNA helicase RuvB [Planctomycetota bacterium]